jgi:hypothetical protein
MLRLVTLLAVLTLAARAEKIEFDVKAGEATSVTLPSVVDDSHLRDPRGYAGHGPRARVFTRRIELSNTGTKPLVGHLLITNGRNFSSAENFKKVLGGSEGRIAAERLFTFWVDHRSHAGASAKVAEEPIAALNFWGYTLCGEDTQALARLARVFDLPARHVLLNGHIAAEYEYDGGWHVIDGDQNACYLRLDNRTLASAAEIRADPFLALRTKVFGKHSPMSRATATFNTGLFEHVVPNEPKAIRLKAGPAPLNTFTLEQGESLVWHCDTPPEVPAGALDTEKPEVLRTAALATIEHRFEVKKRPRDKEGVLTIHEPFPILKVLNETTGESVSPKEIAFKASILTKAETDKVSVVMQCSQVALPLLSKGDNTVLLDAERGKAHVVYYYDPLPGAILPSVAAVPVEKGGRFKGPPSFTIASRPAADRIWWQISSGRDFAFVPPNFNAVVPATPTLKFDGFTETFFSPGRSYFLRLKAHSGGIWSEWSPPVEFRVDKPAQPGEPRFAAVPGGGVRLSWVGVAEEYLVFGSNRADFVPENLAGEEIVAMEHAKVTEKRPNRNLVATVKGPEIELQVLHRFYRVIARKGGVFSVPGDLWKLPEPFAAKLPPALVLQVRASKQDGKDVYRAREEKLPAARASE